MALKFLDLAVGLPHLWEKIVAQITTHNSSTTAHSDIRDTVSGLSTSVENKVDKVSGKSLSSNDYTTDEKNKLSGIEAGANKTVVDSALSATSTNPVQNKAVNTALASKANTSVTDSLQSSVNTLNTRTTTAATTSAMGMMSAADKQKLNSIAQGATAVTVDSELSNNSFNPVQNKVIYAALNSKVDSTFYNQQKIAIDESVQEVEDALTAFKATKGENGGLAPLNDSGLIDSAYLPSYVDDVLEYENYSAFPLSAEAETGKIYVDKSTNKTYRWSGTSYVEISSSLALGTTSSTAFRGDYGNTAYLHAFAKGSAFANGLYKITTNEHGHITAATAVAKGDITALGIPAENTTYSNATSSAAGLMAADDKTKLDGIEAITETEIDAVCGASVAPASEISY